MQDAVRAADAEVLACRAEPGRGHGYGVGDWGVECGARHGNVAA